jgi:GNAT superfamily N-acetyltransferase
MRGREPAPGPGVIRLARLDERPSIERLIARSVRELCKHDYSPAQLDAALGSAFGVDSQLVEDGTYFVVEEASSPIAAGGWSFRRTLFGADARPERAPEPLDPAFDAARIRAFFVAPEHARRGLGRQLLGRCEAAALAWGFQSAELAATLTGERLYRAMGYLPLGRFSHPLGAGLTIDFVSMRKRLV